MSKKKITVFTPTYNRAYIINNLYESLKKQTIKDFEWIIVDDGSEDNTTEIVEMFKKEGIIDIKYIKKQNGGKHTALNKGIENANGELFLTIDSDDILIENGLEILIDKWDCIKSKEDTCGIMALYSYKNGECVGSKFPKEKLRASYTELYNKYGVSGDKGIAFKTDILKKYKYPEYEGVKFITENVVWHQISHEYKFDTINEPIAIIEYLEDGYTKNCLKKELIRGMVYSYIYVINNHIISFKKFPILWYKNYVMFIKHELLSKEKSISKIDSFIDRIMCYASYPIGYVLYLKVKNKYDEINKC